MHTRLLERIPRILHDVAFRRYWTGQSLSLIGGQVSAMAVPLTAVIVLDATEGVMGLISAAGTIPSLLLSLHAGAWIDRRGRRRQTMLAADLARALLLGSIPMAFYLGWLSLPWLIIIQLLTGICSVFFRVSASTLFVSLVSKDRYVEANSLIQGSNAFAWLVGPSIGGFLVQVLSAPAALFADALSFVASAGSLASIHPEEPSPARKEPGHLTAGLKFVWASPVLRPLVLAQGSISLFRGIFMAMYVLYLTNTLHVTPAELGIILGPGSVGALLGSAAAARVNQRIGLGSTFLISTLLSTAPGLLVPMVGGPHLLVVALLFLAEAFSGMGLMVSAVSHGSIQVAAVPNALRSRVAGAMQIVNIGIHPLGALLGGVLATIVGVRGALWVASVGAVLGVLWLLPSPILRMRTVNEFLPEE